MKKYWIEYSNTWKNVPLSFWTHRPVDNLSFYEANKFDPPAPDKCLNGNYKIYNIEFDGFQFCFSSIQQFEEFIKVLSNKILPRTIDISKKNYGGVFLNSHWLGRLPAKTEKWKYRRRMISSSIFIINTPVAENAGYMMGGPLSIKTNDNQKTYLCFSMKKLADHILKSSKLNNAIKYEVPELREYMLNEDIKKFPGRKINIRKSPAGNHNHT